MIRVLDACYRGVVGIEYKNIEYLFSFTILKDTEGEIQVGLECMNDIKLPLTEKQKLYNLLKKDLIQKYDA